jgi:hypothetical protein
MSHPSAGFFYALIFPSRRAAAGGAALVCAWLRIGADNGADTEFASAPSTAGRGAETTRVPSDIVWFTPRRTAQDEFGFLRRPCFRVE